MSNIGQNNYVLLEKVINKENESINMKYEGNYLLEPTNGR